MIRMGELQGGLYKLVTSSFSIPSTTSHFSNCFSIQSDVTLWYFRLGHPSSSRLQLLHWYIPCLSSKFDSCTTCPLAKQKLLLFPVGNNKCDACFDLVHFDIWGPMATPTHNIFKYFFSIVDDYSRAT